MSPNPTGFAVPNTSINTLNVQASIYVCILIHVRFLSMYYGSNPGTSVWTVTRDVKPAAIQQDKLREFIPQGINAGAQIKNPNVMRELQSKAEAAKLASYSYTQYRVEPWVVACITALCLIQGAFISGVMNPHLALLLVSLYSFVCYILSNNLMLHIGIQAGFIH